eukprot:gnl/TRDRNA2_/TRDRNA2_78018_c2_seq1.p2 gnl/TRDRNA2_/TRDRNA2_78018_c2~~gnl/TRDRNA2_/TRDRNA2_78018_c2_seq1.p2  ORF type:complete len:143 (-),score=17.09 gnl/TRDRNA2_/TRDRNA2_78018_c2_seq1:399-827(-)
MLFALSMFVTGLITVVFTSIKDDVAMGRRDTVHCVAASIYVVYHFLVNKWVLGIDLLTNGYALTMAASISICGVCQALRIDDNKLTKQIYDWMLRTVLGRVLKQMKFQAVLLAIECVFTFTENSLFLAFLLGMMTGRATATS